MNNKAIALTLLLAAASFGAAAQETLQKEVEVTRAYEPSVGDFFKLGLQPDLTDTAQMRPEFNYEITPRPLSYGFDIERINPAKINTIENRRLFPYYVKAGVGYPLRSLLDFRMTRPLSPQSTLGVWLNHRGQYAKIRNDQGVKAPSFQSFNSLGITAEKKFRRDWTLAGEAAYDFNNVTRYGYYTYGNPLPESFDTTRQGLGQFFHDVRGKIAFGNSFTDLSKFNFRVTADVSYFADRFKYDQLEWRAGAEAAFGVGMDGRIRIDADYDATNGLNNLDDYKNDVLTAGAVYGYDNGDFRFSLGADYVYENESDGSRSRLLPRFTVSKDLFEGRITPFAEVDGRVTKNDYRHLAGINPYIASGATAPNTTQYDARIGIRGTLGGGFKYKLYGGYSYAEDICYFVNLYDYHSQGNTFGTLSDDLKIWTVGLETEAKLWDALGVYVGAWYRSYDSEHYAEAGGMPEIEGNVGLTWNYRKKLYLDAHVTVIGERYFYQYRDYTDLEAVKASAMPDLHFQADYFFSERLGVFVHLGNLFNRDLYRFNRYKLLGINAQAGVKLSF